MPDNKKKFSEDDFQLKIDLYDYIRCLSVPQSFNETLYGINDRVRLSRGIKYGEYLKKGASKLTAWDKKIQELKWLNENKGKRIPAGGLDYNRDDYRRKARVLSMDPKHIKRRAKYAENKNKPKVDKVAKVKVEKVVLGVISPLYRPEFRHMTYDEVRLMNQKFNKEYRNTTHDEVRLMNQKFNKE